MKKDFLYAGFDRENPTVNTIKYDGNPQHQVYNTQIIENFTIVMENHEDSNTEEYEVITRESLDTCSNEENLIINNLDDDSTHQVYNTQIVDNSITVEISEDVSMEEQHGCSGEFLESCSQETSSLSQDIPQEACYFINNFLPG